MKSILSRPSAVAALLYASAAYGSAIQYCPSSANGICYQVAVPQVSASSDSGNIYFQISAPTSFQWVALGTGTQMDGSNIFLMYQDGSGNLTLSPRLGTQYTMPTLDTSSTAAQLTLLAGSGVSADGSTMTANVACANCQSWNGGSGSMSLSSTSAGWIGAWKSGSSLATTSESASISQHDDTATFNLDLTEATISSDSNPFVSSGSGSSGSGSGSGSSGSGSSGSGSSGSGSGSSGNGGSSSNGSGVTVENGVTNRGPALVAHGVVMALVMVILYPAGSLLMPMFRLWWVHALVQTASFVLMWVGFGLGVKVANDRDLLFKQAHTNFGTAITCLFVLQPVLGYVHHLHYKRFQARSTVSHAHIWYGRVLMLTGVINGGIGLNLTMEKQSLVVAYSVVAAIMGVLYIGVKAGTTLMRRRSAARGDDGGAKYNSDSPSNYQDPGQSAQRSSQPESNMRQPGYSRSENNRF